MTYSYHTRLLTESIGYWNINNNPPNWATFLLTTQTSRINTIKYNYPTRAATPVTHDVDQLTTIPGSRIEFRPSNTINSDFQFLVNSIFIYHANSTLPITEYRIDTQGILVNSPGCINKDVQPNEPRQSHTRVVNSIQRYVNTDGDATTNDPGFALPATTFSYTAFRHYGSASNSCFSFHYLTGYQNGYGGSVSFTYTSDNRSFGSYAYNGYNDYDWPTIGYNYTVSSASTNDGRNASILTSYFYTQPCYGQLAGPPSGAVTCATADSPQYGNIVGYRTTIKTNYDYNGTTALNRQITTFSQASSSSIGRPEQIDLYAGTTTLMSRTNHNYLSDPINGIANMFTYTSQTTTRNYSNGYGTPDISSKVVYQYATVNQGNVQYGNLTHIKEYDDINAATYYRETRRTYYPNTTNWIVGSVGVEGVYDSAGNLQSGTWYHYDGSNGNASTPPTKGALTRLSKIVPTSCGSVDGCTYARQTIDTYSTYNGYGNLTATTTYSGYGYRYFNTNWAIVQENPPTTMARITNITYETGYNLYPVQVSNPLGHPTKFEIYGFKNIDGTLISLPVDSFQRQPGLLAAVIDPNLITTKYEYDPFGRLHAVYDAYSFSGYGDEYPWNGNPLTLYKYWDNTWNNGTVYLNPSGNAPFEITEQTRIGSFPAPANSSSGYAFNEQTFFDGFVRTIQTRSVWNWVEGQSLSREIITSTAYNAQGQVSCQTVPYDVPFYTDRGKVWPASPFVADSCTSKAHTATTYDGLGRPLTTTAPDGSITENLHAVTNTITVDGYSKLSRVQTRDANGHLTNQFTNSRGQLVLVRNNTGSAWGSYVTYLDTQYYYDLQGNLEMVQQRDPNDSGTGSLHMTTTMTYDNFGRKIGMVDPDMGSWTYQYNAVGSLISQKDARGNQLCFRYDDLDRLLNRTQDSTPADACPTTPPTSGSNHLATYTYDPVNGKGQIGTVSWGPTPTQNKDTFTYDTLGRMYKQTRLIDNRSYAMETTSFDPLHRPLTIKYPTNEIVTLTYDHEGEQTLTAGTTDTLVSDIKYNDRGQLVLFDRGGNAPSTTFLYHPQNDASGGGLGDSNFRLKTIQHGAAGTTNAFPDFTYEYDKVGNITKMSALNTAGTDTQTFTYDHLNRLLTAGATGGVANYSQTYAYNKLGNITSGPSGTYNYNEVTWNTNCTNLPTQSLPHAVRKIGSYYFCYDKNGNMVTRSDSTSTYAQGFDVENRLISVTPSGGGTTSFAYDANGIRVKTTRPSGSIVYTPFPNFEEEFRPGGQANLLAPDDVMAAPALVERENSGNWLASVNLGTFPLMTARTRLVLFLALACLTLVCLLILVKRPLSSHHRQLAWRLFTSLFALTVFVFLLSVAQTVRAANDKGRDVQTKQLGPVGSPWVSADIGTVGVTGSADETSGAFTIEGGGANIGGTEDAFQYVYQPLYGDGSITANVASLSGGGTTPRAGLMMRDGLADDAAHVSAVVQGNRIRLLDRASTGGNTTDVPGYTQGAPEWIRIERSGSTFTLSRSNDGSSWAVMDTRTISIGTMIYIGMAVTGNSTTTLATGVFDNVATTGSGATPTPTATNTPLPTNTPTATNTPVSTNTPTPTYTPTPSPTPAPDVWIKRSSYGIAGQMVAFRVTGDPVSANNGLFYVLSDHLGSTSMLVNSNGGTVTGSTTRYLPFGGYRGTAPTPSITDRDFTGQKENMELGLLYYGARFYVPGVGRFLSADTIVPNAASPQSFNRYSYVRNSPLNRIDPTGHVDCGLLGDAADTAGCNAAKSVPAATPLPNIPAGPMVTFSGCETCVWSEEEMATIQESATITGTRWAETLNAAHAGWNLSASDAFLLVYGGSVNFNKTGQSCSEATGYNGCWGSSTGRNNIDVYTDIVDADGVNRLVGDTHWAVHELGHSYVSAVGGFDLGNQRFTLPSLLEYLQGYGFVDRPPGSAWDSTWGFAGGRWEWQRSSSGQASEEFADMYLGWVYGQWEMRGGVMTRDGQQRADFMNFAMPFTVDLAIGR